MKVRKEFTSRPQRVNKRLARAQRYSMHSAFEHFSPRHFKINKQRCIKLSDKYQGILTACLSSDIIISNSRRCFRTHRLICQSPRSNQSISCHGVIICLFVVIKCEFRKSLSWDFLVILIPYNTTLRTLNFSP